jgi:hypothetical protein
MSPNAGGGGEGGGVEGLSQGVQLCTWSPNKLWRSNSILNPWYNLKATRLRGDVGVGVALCMCDSGVSFLCVHNSQIVNLSTEYCNFRFTVKKQLFMPTTPTCLGTIHTRHKHHHMYIHSCTQHVLYNLCSGIYKQIL